MISVSAAITIVITLISPSIMMAGLLYKVLDNAKKQSERWGVVETKLDSLSEKITETKCTTEKHFDEIYSRLRVKGI